MITLLLTLFICLFSYCPSINRLEDHIENNIDYVLPKGAVKDGDYVYIGLTDFVSYDNWILFSRQIKQFDNFPYTNITVPNFLLGQNARITFNSNSDISVGAIIDGEFSVNPSYTSTFTYIEFSYDGSLDYQKTFEIIYHYANSDIKAFGYYSFLEGNESACISNTALFVGDNLVNATNLCIKYNYLQFQDLIGCFNNTVNNFDLGYNSGYGNGYQFGYYDGYQEGINVDATAATIFNGVLEIGLLPINFFLSIFNFEVFGINISGIVSGLLTVAVVIIIIRFLFGGKDNDK